MELIFIYVSEYQGLSNVGVNFSPEFRFDYSKTSKKLSFTENLNWPKEFWINTNINSISGIIGKNGSGKTTLMRLILRTFVLNENEHRPENVIVVYRNNNKSKNLNCYCHQSIKINDFPNNIRLLDKLPTSKATLIFHSNHFDPFWDPMDFTRYEITGMINLSTNYLLQKDKETYLARSENSSKLDYSKALSLHRAMELMRQVNFIRKYSDKSNFLKIKIPQYLRISPNTTTEEWILSSQDFEIEFPIDLLNEFSRIEKGVNVNKSLRFKFFKSNVFDLINHFRIEEMSNNKINRFVEMIIDGLKRIDRPDDISLERFFISLTEESKYSFISKSQNDLKSLFNLFKITKLSSIGDCYFFDLQMKSLTGINKFLDTYFGNNRITSFIDIGLSYSEVVQTIPSSGELALLNFFSRFASIKKMGISENLIVLLDEVELSLHPEWQREFLSNAIEFFKNEFGSKRRIHIIISSHSPFIVSDLPRECLVFLEDKPLKTGQTFGANINSLFADAFFLENSFMGEFAKSKIEDLINFLKNNKTYEEWTQIKAKRIIALIGDDLIRMRLNDLYTERFNDGIESLETRKTKLLLELSEIDRQLNSGK